MIPEKSCLFARDPPGTPTSNFIIFEKLVGSLGVEQEEAEGAKNPNKWRKIVEASWNGEEQEETTSSKKNLPVDLRSFPLPFMLNTEDVRRVRGTLSSAEAGIFTNYNTNPSPRYRFQNIIRRTTTKVLEKACCPIILSVKIGLLKPEHSNFPQKKVSSSDYTVRGLIKEAE